MGNKFVRVKDDDTGHEYSIGEEFAKHTKGLTILDDKQAVDENGRPAAPKPNVKLGTKTGTGSASLPTTKSGGAV